ncbi:MAG: hypothetical protein ACP5M9_00930 [Candidatus Micrarchaeia archaeon]
MIAFIALTSMPGIVFGGYWFQFGARGGQYTTLNNGASVNIQTVVNQNIKSGSSGYWIGENLANGAFLQIGYLIENQSGVYPSFCNVSGCGGYQNLTKGNAEWFYEYFPPSFSQSFLGAIGPDGSAGKNGTINNYRFYVNGTIWNFVFDGRIVGNITLGSNNSGQNIPLAFGELANTSNSNTFLKPVIFSNLSFYKNGVFLQVPHGYTYIGYGEGSQTDLANPYGIQEIGNRVNYFEVGSDLIQYPDNTKLWTLGYSLKTISNYGNFNSILGYVAYSQANINVPNEIYLGNNTRVLFVGWDGTGTGSYTGFSNYSNVYLDQNITEQATWEKQYYVTISSKYGNVTGSGWYSPNQTLIYKLSSNIFYLNNTARVIFAGWNIGGKNLTGITKIAGPINISPIWKNQYYIKINSTINGTNESGWYYKNSTINLSLKKPVLENTPFYRLSFYSWNNGAKTQNLTLRISSPLTIYPIYKKEYLTKFNAINVYGNPIKINNIYLDNNITNDTTYLYSGIKYTINKIIYDGASISLNKSISVNSTSSINITMPLYNLSLKTTDLFGIPVNALVNINFYNGTSISEYTGSSGTLLFKNVPYGFATGTVYYGQISTTINAANGVPVKSIFISLLNIVIFILVIVIAGIIFVLASRKMHKKNEELHI